MILYYILAVSHHDETDDVREQLSSCDEYYNVARLHMKMSITSMYDLSLP